MRAGTPTCAWPGQGNVSGDRLLVQRTPESQHDVPFPRSFHVLRARPISGKLLPVPLLTHNHRALTAPLLALPVMAEAPKTGDTCPSLVKASNCPARPCRWRAHSHLLLGRSGVQGQGQGQGQRAVRGPFRAAPKHLSLPAAQPSRLGAVSGSPGSSKNFPTHPPGFPPCCVPSLGNLAAT